MALSTPGNASKSTALVTVKNGRVDSDGSGERRDNDRGEAKATT
jgi:hypothetical protein